MLKLVELSRAQDIEAGDGTTSVVIVAGALLEAAERLLQKGIHPTSISDAFQKAALKAVEILKDISQPVELTDKEALIKSAATSLNSKVIQSKRRNSFLIFSFLFFFSVILLFFFTFSGSFSTIESSSSSRCYCGTENYGTWKRSCGWFKRKKKKKKKAKNTFFFSFSLHQLIFFTYHLNTSVLLYLVSSYFILLTFPYLFFFFFHKDIKVIKKLGGTTEDTELIDGLVFTQKSCNVNGPKRIEKAKIGLIQFCISPPKTDVSLLFDFFFLFSLLGFNFCINNDQFFIYTNLLIIYFFFL